jgi:hypothetical protein
MHCMEHEDQITLRLPSSLAMAIERTARERDIPKARLVREALVAYLDHAPAPAPDVARERLAPFVGAVSYDPGGPAPDEITASIERHNFRD